MDPRTTRAGRPAPASGRRPYRVVRRPAETPWTDDTRVLLTPEGRAALEQSGPTGQGREGNAR